MAASGGISLFSGAQTTLGASSEGTPAAGEEGKSLLAAGGEDAVREEEEEHDVLDRMKVEDVTGEDGRTRRKVQT